MTVRQGSDQLRTTTDGVVAALEHALCQRIGAPRYDLWFRAKTVFRLDADRLRVGVPNRFYQEWLQKTFTSDVAAAAGELLGAAPPVAFEIDPGLFQAARQREAEVQLPQPSANACPVSAPTPSAPLHPPAPAPRPEPRVRIRRWRKLADFAEGSCNRVALAAARHVVEAPGDGPNPLLLHGPAGCGKSHLLEGILSGLHAARPDWRIVFATAEEFTHRFVQAVRIGKLGGFRKQYRDCDALLVDDVQFFAKKRQTQVELLHTLEALERDGRPVVFTCDGHPRLADELMPELIDRLMGGAVWGLSYPEPETRLAILRGLNFRAGADALPDPVLQLLAD